MKKIHLATAIGAAVCASTTFASAAPTADPAHATKSISPAMTAPSGEATAPAPTTPREKEPELAPNSIYIEGLGAGLAYSLNYERMVIDDLAVRVGISYLSIGASATTSAGTTSASASLITVPITASYTGIRSGKHALELGAGTTLAFASGSASGFGVNSSASGMMPFGDLIVGYRIHPINHAGFNFRVGAMALIGKGLSLSTGDPEAIGVLPWLYVSLGASF
jgi:hypothetical protein